LGVDVLTLLGEDAGL
jgi:hypothetical protein